jgi:hypothetical protein
MRLHTKIEAALTATGLPWEIETGGKHHKLRVGGRLAAILPNGGGNEADRRAVLNTVSNIRRVARELHTCASR